MLQFDEDVLSSNSSFRVFGFWYLVLEKKFICKRFDVSYNYLEVRCNINIVITTYIFAWLLDSFII